MGSSFTSFFSLSRYDDDKFASWFVCREMCGNFLQRSSDAFLVNLAYFAAYGTLPFISERLRQLCEEFHNAVGAFIENHRALLVGESQDM